MVEIDFSKEWTLRRSWETPSASRHEFPPISTMPAEAWIEFTKQIEGLDVMQNLVTNFLYDVRGDTATVRCYLYCVLYLRGAQGGDRSPIGGEYTFGCQRIDGAWKINRVRFEALWIDGNPDIRAQAIARRAAMSEAAD